MKILEFEGVIEGRPIAMKRATCQREVEACNPGTNTLQNVAP
jgi:hypothetical protein